MSESFYTSSSASTFPNAAATSTPPPSSPITGSAPPPPPPKPVSHLNSQAQSANASRTGTPALSSTPTAAGPGVTNSPRPQPPVPNAQPSFTAAPSQSQPPYEPIPPPSLSDHWIPPQLQDKPINELHTLVNNPSLVASIASTHPSYASSLGPLQAAINANIQLAQQVSQVENQLRQLRDETGQLLLKHASLQAQWRRKQTEMDDALSPWGPRQMYQRLVSSISEQEALLRATQESFLEGSTSDTAHGKASEKEVNDWVRRIREGSTTLEKRREMRARWDEGRVGGWR
ncbi:hypothetical protein PV08_02686 [Exophiala spinifera]|uniref:VPS37 C-terminal domain-containing protein n=1 Tax=Exophiala spinifera TaxID=91928 RepID=A0A0D2BHF1_9EURO|nr:uncharacterized protein PV08_02686 [Exophiala spinifera]KIW18398.1 hypothetical protein PV08_02686 [Exophiala spinifera]